MSSDMRIKKVCQFCKDTFIAKQHRTKFCSHRCGQLNYKQHARDEKIAATVEAVKEQVSQPARIKIPQPIIEKALIPMKELALVIGISERTIFRLVKDAAFPKIKIGKRLLFQKEKVLTYIIHKYGNP